MCRLLLRFLALDETEPGAYAQHVIDEYAPDADPEDKSALYNVPLITAILQEVAAEERWISYSEILMRLGFRFTRPKMRVVCKTLETVDAAAIARGEPPLAVLVVRESDGLPGQGWWVGRRDYQGVWTGPDARAFIQKHQHKAFRYWKRRALR